MIAVIFARCNVKRYKPSACAMPTPSPLPRGGGLTNHSPKALAFLTKLCYTAYNAEKGYERREYRKQASLKRAVMVEIRRRPCVKCIREPGGGNFKKYSVTFAALRRLKLQIGVEPQRNFCRLPWKLFPMGAVFLFF